jgi:hypothetical protein
MNFYCARPFYTVSSFKSSLVDPRLRASNEALLILHLLKRGQQAVLHCAHRATTVSSWGLCEQEGWWPAPSHPSQGAHSGSIGPTSKLQRKRVVC